MICLCSCVAEAQPRCRVRACIQLQRGGRRRHSPPRALRSTYLRQEGQRANCEHAAHPIGRQRALAAGAQDLQLDGSSAQFHCRQRLRAGLQQSRIPCVQSRACPRGQAEAQREHQQIREDVDLSPGGRGQARSGEGRRDQVLDREGQCPPHCNQEGCRRAPRDQRAEGQENSRVSVPLRTSGHVEKGEEAWRCDLPMFLIAFFAPYFFCSGRQCRPRSRRQSISPTSV